MLKSIKIRVKIELKVNLIIKVRFLIGKKIKYIRIVIKMELKL